MKLPSKTTPYKHSVLALFPKILAYLNEREMRISDLREELSEVPFGDFVNALDCLYALGAIEIDVEGGQLYRVDADSV